MKIVIFSLLLSFVANAQGLISLRKNKEILRTYEELTGIKMDSEIQRIYDSSFISLPKNGDVTELNGFTLVAMVKLTQTFCSKLVAKDRTLPDGSRWALNSIDTEKEVSRWSDAEIENLIQSYREIFWNQKLDSEVLGHLKDVFKVMAEEKQPVAQSASMSLTCAAMLMSPYVYTK